MRLKLLSKCIAVLATVALLAASFSSCSMRKKLDEPVTFIVATDIHYISPSLLGDGSYFTPSSGKRNDGKVVQYVADITDAFLAEVIAKKPKALILGGDLTLNGALESHKELVQKLLRVKEQGIDVLVIPGNHDVDQTAVSYVGEVPVEAEAASSYDFAETYECLIPESTVSRDESSLSYVYEASDKLWIVMIDTNTYGQCFVKDETLAWLEEQLATAEKKGIDVISVSHQNLYAHNELLSFGFQLYNYQELLDLYEKYSVQCNFSGHIHVQSIANESVPEIVTSSMSVTGLHYGEIIYDGKGIDYSARSVNVDAYAEDIGATDENLLDFADYATWYFEEVARVQTRDHFTDSDLDENKIELLAETYAEINSAYFEGREIDLAEFGEGIELWRKQENSFTLRYIETMIKEADDGEQSIRVKFK